MKRFVGCVFVLIGLIIMIISAYNIGRSSVKCKSVNSPIAVHDTVHTPIPDPVIVYREIPIKVDTDLILRNYFAKKNYKDTIINMPDLRVTLNDVITENELKDRVVILDYKRPERIKNNSLFIGVDFGKRNLSGILSYRYKNTEYRAGYDLVNQSFLIGISKSITSW